jgi:hypothetical protein
MKEKEAGSAHKGMEILRQMREGTTLKRHLDQQKLRAEESVRRAIQNRDEQAYREALIELGIDLESDLGKAHLNKFRQLPPKR